MRKWIAGASIAGLVISAAMGVATAQEEPPDPPSDPDPVTANVEVRVWQDVNNALSIYISARPEGGSWAALGTIPLPLDDGHSSSGRFRYGDIAVDVPVGAATATVEVRVWQDVSDALSIYISARPEDGSWRTLGTIPLPLDDGHSSSGRFRYGDITVTVTLGALFTPSPTPTPTPTPAPWVDPRPDNTYTLRELAAMATPAAPQPPPRPDHVLAFDFLLIVGGDVRIEAYLIDNAADTLVKLTHTYNSREYPVVCDIYGWTHDRAECRYSGIGPLNSSGTGRLSVEDAASPYSRFHGDFTVEDAVAEFTLDSVTLKGDLLTCVSVGAGGSRNRYWCYDPATYAAWESARDRALAVPDDLLERYLRAQGNAPLWRGSMAYEAADEAASDDPRPAAIAWQYAQGVGDYTTSAFEVRPYVRHWVTPDPSNAAVTLVCIPNDPGPDGYLAVTAQDLIVLRLWEGEFTARGSFVCEFEIEADDEWTLEVAIEVQ